MKTPDKITEELIETAQLALEQFRNRHRNQLELLHLALTYALVEGNKDMRYTIFRAIQKIQRLINDCVPELTTFEMVPWKTPTLPDTILRHHFGEVRDRLPFSQEFCENSPVAQAAARMLRRIRQAGPMPPDSTIHLPFGKIQPAQTAS